MLMLTKLATAGFSLEVQFRKDGHVVTTLCESKQETPQGPTTLVPVTPLVQGVAMLHGNGDLNLVACLDITGRMVLKKALAIGLVK